ncbi:unnamed protein product [Urochloa humidicola]
MDDWQFCKDIKHDIKSTGSEIYHNTTLFTAICSTSSKMTEPIQSRCAIVDLGHFNIKEHERLGVTVHSLGHVYETMMATEISA